MKETQLILGALILHTREVPVFGLRHIKAYKSQVNTWEKGRIFTTAQVTGISIAASHI